LFVSFIARMEDVTKQILQDIPATASEEERNAVIAKRIYDVSQKAIAGTHYEAVIKPFFYGAEYYMFVTETFRDVRLVGAPPSSIGKFGGDTDNWMWTRHTGDFSLFRIYASPDGKPTRYSKDNVPFKPRHSLPISLKGVQKGDFTMVFGFPGRTREYLPSYAVDMVVNLTNPHRIKIRDKRLAVWDIDMKASDAVRIQYAAKYASVANAWKKWIGEVRGIKKFDGIRKKQDSEKQFQEWADADANRKTLYGNLLPQFKELYAQQSQVAKADVYFGEAMMGIEALRLSNQLSALGSAELSAESPTIQAAMGKMKAHFKDYNKALDQKIFAALIKLTLENVEAKFIAPSLQAAIEKHKGNTESLAAELYAQSVLPDEAKMTEILNNYNAANIAQLQSDPLYALAVEAVQIYSTQVFPTMSSTEAQLEKLQRTYVQGLREMLKNKKFYPDANSTLRVAFGTVNNYKPRDGVEYNHYTTLDGIMEKEDPNSDEFTVPAKLKELHAQKDYGQYAVNGELPVCFIAANHTTGGNSGSPVINAKGELIGTNFDRNWEGTMSDLMYDPSMCRNIVLDVHYTLFVIDKFAGAGHLIKEMKIVR
jgi:Peptidase S46